MRHAPRQSLHPAPQGLGGGSVGLRRTDPVRRPEGLANARGNLAQHATQTGWVQWTALHSVCLREGTGQRRGILLPLTMLSHEHRRPDFSHWTVDTESKDGRLVLARDRRHAFLGDGMPESLRQLRARAPRRRRLLAQAE